MGESGVTKFSATSAGLGNLYQVRSALLWTLRPMKTDANFAVGMDARRCLRSDGTERHSTNA